MICDICAKDVQIYEIPVKKYCFFVTKTIVWQSNEDGVVDYNVRRCHESKLVTPSNAFNCRFFRFISFSSVGHYGFLYRTLLRKIQW